MSDRHDFCLKDESVSSVSQYITAITSHSSYWESDDVMYFILQRLAIY